MIMSILIGLFVLCNLFLILLITMQKNHGGFWSGPSGSESSILFGGNQGIDILQKLTWLFGIILIFGCLTISLYESSSSRVSRFYQAETKKEDKQKEKINPEKKTDIETNKEITNQEKKQ